MLTKLHRDSFHLNKKACLIQELLYLVVVSGISCQVHICQDPKVVPVTSLVHQITIKRTLLRAHVKAPKVPSQILICVALVEPSLPTLIWRLPYSGLVKGWVLLPLMGIMTSLKPLLLVQCTRADTYSRLLHCIVRSLCAWVVERYQ